jgi:hypothetical protein
MKIICLLLIILIAFKANATNYYLSNSGNDSNTGTNPSSKAQAQKTYYVSNSGSDANSGTSSGSAWKTVSKVNSSMPLFNPRDSILFKRGDTWTNSTITVGKAGSNGNNIIISAYGIGAKPIISGATNSPAITVTAAIRGYWTIDNLDIRASGHPSGFTMSLGIYHNYWTSDIGIVPGWVIQNCTFDCAVLLSGPYTTVQNNAFDGSDGGGTTNTYGAIIIRGSGTDSAGTYATIKGNTVHNYVDRGIWTYNKADHPTIDSNTVYNITAGSDNDGMGINVDGYAIPVWYAKVYGNTVYNCDGIGISNENGYNAEYYDNIIHNCGLAGLDIIFYGSNRSNPSNINYHNNVVYDCDAAFKFWDANTFTIENNTFYEGLGTDKYAVWCSSASTYVSNVTFVNNIISGAWTHPIYLPDTKNIWTQFDYNDIIPAGTEILRRGATSSTLLQVQGLGFMAHGFISDPLLVSPTSNFFLQPGSPAIDAGENVGLPFNGVAPDIGAFEYAAPKANAGADQTITLPVNDVTLSGSAIDEGGTFTNFFFWTQISGPSSATIANATSATSSVSGLLQGVYQFQLKVVDNGAVGLDTMKVTVNAPANIPPVANAGVNQAITLPINIVTLSGSGSDVDGTVVSYLWTKISGPSSGSITNINSAATSVTGLVQGVYLFQLEVTDNNGATRTGMMQITVNAAINIPPVANAGTDQTITLPLNITNLSGSGSDADGTIVSYLWTKISGPSSGTIPNINSAATSVTGLVQGVYLFQLEVTDNNGATGTDMMQVTVNAAANIPPIANAGADQTITLPNSGVMLSGSGSDADGTIVSYLWTKISGPSSGTIGNVNAASTVVSGLVQGVYQFQLQVKDNNGATATSAMQVTVNSSVNIPLSANAGPDQMIILPTNSVTLSGSGDVRGAVITTYSWKQISGPSTGDIVSPGSAVTQLNNLISGNYQLELTVTDNLGGNSSDTVAIIVAAPRLDMDIQSNSINVYPNPVTDIATLEINSTQPNLHILVTITNMNGQIVYKNDITSGQINISQTLNLSNLMKGAYAVTAYFSNVEKQTLKILKL